MKRKAFTLIELLVVIAIIAILAAILFPVFARAKASAKFTSSLSGMKQIGLGLVMYSTDYDDVAVPEYGYGTPQDPNQYHDTTTWVGRVYPYVKNRSLFFDKTVADPREDTAVNGEPMFQDPFYGAGYEYMWQWVTNFSLNTDGYSRAWSGTGCTNINWSGEGAYRSLTAIDEPATRLVVTPVRYATLPYGWMRFYAIDASWPTVDRYAPEWDWYQIVYDARRDYPGPRFIGAHADGHAAKFGKEKFIAFYADNPGGSEAQTYSEYCARMDAKNLWSFWGRPWSGN